MTSLHISSERTEAEDILLVLVSASCDLNARNKLGRTALHLAAKQGNLPSLKTLLDAGCDRNIKDKLGFTAVGLAFKFNQKASADVLLHYKPKRNQSLCKETVPRETFSKDDVCENSRHRNQNGAAKLFDMPTAVKNQHLCDKTLLKFTHSVTNRNAVLSLKIFHLIFTILTQNRRVMDGSVSTTSIKTIESVATIFERKLLDLMLAASTSLIRCPLSSYTIRTLDDKLTKRCLHDLTFERSRQLGRNLESKVLMKLMQGLQCSLRLSSKSFMTVSNQRLPPSLEWKPQKKAEPTVERLNTSAQILVKSSNGHSTENSLKSENLYDNTILEAPCDLTALQSQCKQNCAVVDNEVCEGCLKKLNKILTVLGDSGKVLPEDFYEIESRFVGNNVENCLSCLDHALSIKSEPALAAEDVLEVILQHSDLFIFCLKQKSSLFSTLLSKVLPDNGPWRADKIAKIFLRVCVALASDQHLLLSCAAAVMKRGLLHEHSNPTTLGTCILVGMGLLKQEDEVDIVKDLEGPLLALEHLFTEKYFPRDLAAIFASFLCKSSPKLFGLDQLRLRALVSAVIKEILPTSTQEAESDTGKHFKRICDIVAVEGDWELLMKCVDTLFSRVFVTLKCDAWPIGEGILIYLGLLKSEFHIETVRNLRSTWKALHHTVKQSYFPPLLKQLLDCFLRKPNPVLTPYSTEVGEILSTMTNLS